MAENFFGITNTGRLRDNNEDTFIAETLSNGWIAACVIDGVGGYEGGEVAAEIARETIRKKLNQGWHDPLQALKEAVLEANMNIYQEKQNNKGNNQMACVLTLALVDVENNQFYYAHVGDTRLYLLRDQSLVKVTKDHSFVGFLEDSGRLSEKEAMEHPKRNEINKALGFDPQIEQRADYIEIASSPFLPGDMLLLCSDGLSDLVNRNAMSAVLVSPQSLEAKGHQLIDAANHAGGKDNITVVIVSNDKKPVSIKATKPVKKNETNDEVKKPLMSSNHTGTASVQQAKKTSNAAVWILSLLCLFLAGACYWLWSKSRTTTTIPVDIAKPVYSPNDVEKRLTDSLGLATNYLVLNDSLYGKSIVLGDTVFIRQDTMHINGNGVVLQSDSAYKGPAFVATNNNKTLILENLILRGFSPAVVWHGKNIQLRNVRFQNTAVPVQHYLYLPADSALTGTIRDTFLFTNSLPK